ncbi:MAG: glycosyltransferase family 2 protein [Microgenomates group bacterium]
MLDKPLISAVINVRNEADNLAKCLRSLSGFATEIIITDMHSTDNSKEIALNAGAKVYDYRWLNHVEPARNFALAKASGKWIILLDPDEYLNQTLKRELLKITQRKDIDWVKIPRKNIIFNKWMRHSRCWPDYLIRFFKKKHVTWKNEIHSQPNTLGHGLTILDNEKLAIRHLNYSSISQYLNQTIRYSRVQAEELLDSGYKLKISDLILKPIQEFNSRYYFAQGYKDGIHGLVFCLLQSFSICLIYIRLWEKSGFSEKVLSKDSFVSAIQESSFEHNFWFTKYYTQEYSHNIFHNSLMKLKLFFSRITKKI